MEIFDYFSQAAGDPSKEMLEMISGASPIIEILYPLNIAVFSVGCLVLLWAGLAGLARAATSGEFLKPAAQTWLPVRLTVGLGGLLPVFNGLTLAQAAVVVAASLGIGIGNIAWQGAGSGLISWAEEPAFSSPSPAAQGEAARALLGAAVCQQVLNQKNDSARGEMGFSIAEGRVEKIFGRVEPGGPLPWQDFRGIALVYGGIAGYPPDICGGVRLADADVEESQYFSREVVINAHSSAMQSMADELQPLADALAGEQHRAPSPAAIQAAEERYQQTVEAALAQAAGEAGGALDNWMQQGEGKSWIYAGASLAKIASINREIQAAASIKIETVAPSEKEFDTISFLDFVEESQLLTEGAMAPEKTSFSLKKPDLGVLFNRLLRENLAPLLDWLTGADQDLLGGLTSLGHKLILGTLAAMGAVLLALGVASGASLGTLGGLAGSVFSVFVYIFCLPLLGAGLLFAYYLPFLPLVYWILGVLTWLIVFTEALFGAPLWSLSHLVDPAEGEGLGHRTAHGYLFLLQLIFRPALMLGGLAAGWLILQFFGGFLKQSLSIFFGSGAAFSGAAGILGFVACLVMFAYLSWQVCSKAFSLIHHLPAEVLAWVGGHAGRLGGGEEREVEGRATGVVAGVGRGPARGMAPRPGQGGQKPGPGVPGSGGGRPGGPPSSPPSSR